MSTHDVKPGSFTALQFVGDPRALPMTQACTVEFYCGHRYLLVVGDAPPVRCEACHPEPQE